MDISSVTNIVGNLMYLVLLLIAMWGAFCVIMVWMRVAQKRFRNEQEQHEFLQTIERPLAQGDFDGAAAALDGDLRAMPQLALLAIQNRGIGYARVRQLVADRFQRDVLADLEHRLSWVNTVIKTAPMVGLLGTVMGMMGAFGKLAGKANVKPEVLAGDISLALITTACGLAIAIPLVLCTASINVRIRKMEDMVGAGLTRFMDTFREAMARS
ncbi:MAG: MotA/TolQ/ExbB proton channel family protein [Pirellulaceae bacterium]